MGSLILIAYGVVLLAMTIQASVWEAESISDHLAAIYLLVYSGLATLGLVIRDYRLIHYGLPGSSKRELPAEQIEPIRQALESRDMTAAIARYREAVPEAGLPEARNYVFTLMIKLRRQQPDKFALSPLSLNTLNWRGFLICAVIEAAVLGVVWIVMPPSHPASAVSQFAYCLLFGMGLLAAARVQGFRKLLVFAPSLAVMILSEMIVPRLAEATSHSKGAYLCGVLFGVVLIVSAFTPRRQTA